MLLESAKMKLNQMQQYLCWLTALVLLTPVVAPDGDDDSPVKTPTACEVCKFLVVELKERLAETGKSKEVLETGYGLDAKKKRINYSKSELRFTEALQDPHICDKILQYNIHAERKGSQRYGKGRSQTMETLHGLVDKGVKVELGIPYELWDKPSAEVTDIHRKCVGIVEDYEDDIEKWYFHLQDSADLMDYLCVQRVLKDRDQGCLTEALLPDADSASSSAEPESSPSKSRRKNGNEKGDTGAENHKDEL